MAAVVEQSVGISGGPVTSQPLPFDDDVKADSLLICVGNAWHISGPSLSVADDNGNSWGEVYETQYADAEHRGFLAYARNANVGATTVTLTNSSSGMFVTMVIIEVSGMKTGVEIFDQSNEAVDTASTWDSNDITTLENDEYLVGGFAHDDSNQTLTADAPWVFVYEEEDQASKMPISVSGRIVSATLTESYSGDNSTSLTWWSAIASFEAEVAADEKVPELLIGGRKVLVPRSRL